MITLMVGLALGGAVTASLVWVLSGLVDWIPPDVRPYLVGAAAALFLARDLSLLDFRMPQRRSQVPKTILEQAPPAAALGFGFELGLGFRTYVPSSAPYVLIIALALLGEPWWIFLASGVAFGLGRFVMALARYMSSPTSIWDGFMAAYARPVKLASIVVVAPAALALAL